MERKLIRPPVYECSIIKRVLALLTAVVFMVVTFIVTCIVFRSGLLGFSASYLSTTFLIVIFLYFNSERAKRIDIPSKCYHKDLLPHTEYLALRQKYQRACEGQIRITKKGFPADMSAEDKIDMCKSYEEIIKTAGEILNEQDHIRSQCSMNMKLGYIKIPAIYKDDKIQKDKNVKIDNQENINGNDFVESGITSFLFKTNLTDQNHYPFVSQSSAHSEVPTVNHKNDFSVGEKIDMEKIIEKFEILENQIAENKSAKEANDEKMMKQLEILKNQFNEIKAENGAMKESIGKILESQSVF